MTDDGDGDGEGDGDGGIHINGNEGFKVGFLNSENVLQIRCERGIKRSMFFGEFSINHAGWRHAVALGGRILEVCDVRTDHIYRCSLLLGHDENTPTGKRRLIPMRSFERVNP